MNKLALAGLAGGVTVLVMGAMKIGPTALLAAAVSSAVPATFASLFRSVTLSLYTRSWQDLLPVAERPRFWPMLRLRWIGESINSLLPVAQVGGDLVRAHLLTVRGVPGPVAGASLIGDLTAGTLSQLVFTLSGLIALMSLPRTYDLSRPIALGLGLVILVGSGCAAVLRLGVGRIVGWLPLWRLLTARWQVLASGTASLDVALRALFARRRQLAAAFAWHLVGWFTQAIETMTVLALLGAPVGWRMALVIESLSATVRGLAFFVPGGLGVQEATLVVVCRYLGVPADAALALSLVKRLREFVVGLTGLSSWAFSSDGVRSAPPAIPRGST